MSLCRAILLIILSFLLLGCFGGKEEPPPVAAAPPPAPAPIPPTRVVLLVEAQGDVNPTIHGSGAPVVMRIYELKGLSGFNGVDFFTLYDKDQASLGGDLAAKRELLLRPGEKQTIVLEPTEGTGFFAALAAFRNLNSARWRVSAQIPPHQTSVFELKLGGTQMTLTGAASPQSPAAAQAKPAPGAPSAPKVPSLSVPEVPKVSAPSLPSVSVPEVPSVSVPSVSVPSVPSVSVPSIPTVTVPTAP